MSNYTIDKLVHATLDDVNEEGFILWVLHADKVPPHVGISYEGKFYSLKANGKDNGVEVHSIKGVIQKKQITTLCFEIKKSRLTKTLDCYFHPYKKTIPHEISCLDPIKDVFSMKEPRKLVELLDLLYIEGVISFVTGVYVHSFKGIVDYEIADIHARLEKLNNVK